MLFHCRCVPSQKSEVVSANEEGSLKKKALIMLCTLLSAMKWAVFFHTRIPAVVAMMGKASVHICLLLCVYLGLSKNVIQMKSSREPCPDRQQKHKMFQLS